MFVIAQSGGFDYTTVLFLVGIVVVFYMLILRPAKKREQDRKQMIDNLKKGSEIVTIGGIHGKVTVVREKDIIVRIDSEKDIRIKLVRSAVSRILDGEGETGEEFSEDSEKI